MNCSVEPHADTETRSLSRLEPATDSIDSESDKESSPQNPDAEIISYLISHALSNIFF
jgi:hypothetical protein